jgi:hypothetical protein
MLLLVLPHKNFTLKSLLLGLLILFSCIGFSQNKPGKKLSIKKVTGTITLDGALDESDWEAADVAKDFFINYPVDTALAPFQTEARLTFDDHFLYVSFVCYDDGTPDIVQSLRRDFDFDLNDNVGIFIGPYNDGINGFFFITTPRGIQDEGTINSAGAGGDSYNSTWDNKWYSKVVKLRDKWIAEIAIPFKSFRFKSNLQEWDITFLRHDLKRNVISSWIATPIQFIPASFAYSGKLKWEDPSPSGHTNISLIPYVAGGTAVDNEKMPPDKTQTLSSGFDAKIGVTPSLNLDVSVNPDFSQVEVDKQVINLTRFEFKFPERRQFFLENSDLFDKIGFPETRAFFSRRIGLVDTSSSKSSNKSYQKVPILYGVRLSGSINKNWRVSAMNMQTKEKLEFGLPGQSYTVVALQRNFWKQSNVSFSYVEKQSIGNQVSDSTKYFNKDLWKLPTFGNVSAKVHNGYNRVLGTDLEMLSKDNKWYTSAFYSRSFDNYNNSDQQAGSVFVTYTKRHYGILVNENFIQRNYNAEVGYVPSKGVYPGLNSSYLGATGSIYPKNTWVAVMGPTLDINITNLPNGTNTDKSVAGGYNINFLNTSSLLASYSYTYQRLTNTYYLIDDSYIPYKPDEVYAWNSFSLNYRSDQRKVFKYAIGVRNGGFYNGNLSNLNGELSYRYQPFGSLSVKFDYNDIRLPDNYGKEKLFLISPRLDFTFTDKLFFTTFVQYNKLYDNMNLNARFQWRYKPASDFFVVYTENYFTNDFKSKNRALVFKFTYWLNI